MGITRRRGQVLVVFPIVALALLAVIGLLYTLGLIVDQRRTLQTAADAASLSGSWAILQDAASDTLVRSAVVQFATLNGWSSDGSALDDPTLCPATGVVRLCAYYVKANGDFLCSAGSPPAKVHVVGTASNPVPAGARGVQVTVSRQVATILPNFIQNAILQTGVQASAAATARLTTPIPVLVAEGTNAC